MSSTASEAFPPSEGNSSAKSAKPVQAPSILRAAGLIAMVTILSKVLGALRDWQIMTVYGASLASDAYFAAFQIPSFAMVLLGGLGGPFHTATVAVFSKILKDGEKPGPEAKQLASSFMTLTGLIFLAIALMTYVFAEPIMGLILQGGKPELIQNATIQLKIMTPILFFGGLVGIFYGILNIYHCFFWPSLSPAALSVAMSVALLMNPHDTSGHILAWSTVVGILLQFSMQLPEFFRRSFSLKPAFTFQSPEIKQIGEILFPAIIGTTIGQLTTYVDMFFTATLPVGGWTAVVLGNRLIQLPIGVLQTAFLVPIFPRFTRYVADGQWKELKNNFKLGIISLWFICMPILVVTLLFTEPVIRAVFQHGQFDERDTQMVSQVLIFLIFSALPYFARDSITRVFYAFQDSKTPLMVGIIAIVLKAFLDWLLVVHWTFGVGGIAFSTTLMTFFNMFLLGLLSKKHISDLGFREMVIPFIKLVIAGGLMTWVCYAISQPVSQGSLALFSNLSERWLELIQAALVALAGCSAYIAVCLLLHISEVQYLVDRLKGRMPFLK